MHFTPTRSRGVCAAGVLFFACALLLVLTAAPPATGAPFAAGDSAANIELNSSSKLVVTRWVAGHTGLLQRMHLQVKVEGSSSCPLGGRRGYAAGTTGRLRASTYRVLPDGRPDIAGLLKVDEFVPCARQKDESVNVELGFLVRKGAEFATVIRNVDSNPSANYFSTNHLWVDGGIVGANGRNERRPTAADAEYGLDPREVVGWSTDGGASWALPGGPYGGNGGRSFLPTYIQEYADGFRTGQPFIWAGSHSGAATMVFPNVPVPWTISHLGAYTARQGSATLRLSVNGVQRAQATLSGRGMLRAAIAPVAVAPGSTVKVQTSGGLALSRIYADRYWAGIMGLGTRYRFYLEAAPATAVPVYPLPAYRTELNYWEFPAGPVAKKAKKRCKAVKRFHVRRAGVLRAAVTIRCCQVKRVTVRRAGKLRTVSRLKCTRTTRLVPVKRAVTR